MLKLKNLLAIFAIFSLVLVACDEESVINPDLTPEGPTNLEANSLDNSTIALRWDASVTAGVTYVVYVYEGESPTYLKMSDGISGTQVTVDSLDGGTIYRFEVYSEDDVAMSDDNDLVFWSPAMRFTEDGYGADLELFGFESSLGSGLDLYSEEDEAPAVLSVAAKADWDIAFDDRSGGVIGCASIINIGTGDPTSTTEISIPPFQVGSLDDVWGSQTLDLVGTYSETTIDLAEYATGDKNLVFIARTQAEGETFWHYAKVMVIRGDDGNFIQGEGEFAHVLINVSYQKAEGVPYAEIQQKIALSNSTIK